jgi:hypothetical protein
MGDIMGKRKTFEPGGPIKRGIVMRGLLRSIQAASAAVLMISLSAGAQTGVHPGFTMTSLRPSGFNPMVSGLDFMPNGDLVVSTWENFGKTTGSVYIVSNVRTGTAANITFKKFAGGLNEPLGVKVLDGVIHVITRDQLLVLPDSNKDGTAETPRMLASNWGALNANAKILEFAFGLPYRAGKLYMGLATAWPMGTAQAKERGCILEVDAATGAHTPYACGFRTPNGMALGPNDDLFVTENQGNWVPSSKLTHVAKGRFYGVKKEHPAGFPANMTETPPTIWLPHGDISISPTQPVWLKTGVYKGQMIAGDNNLGTLQRFFIEKVGNEYQGAVFRFSAGLEAGANRILTDADGNLYVGGIGTTVWGGWDWNDKFYGLQRMAPGAQGAFEFLAVRSKGASSIEVEFTEPAASGAGTAANWAVRHWGYIPEETYGAGKQPTQTLTVQGVQLSADGKKATLNIPGLKARNVVHIRLSNVASQSGKAIWTNDAWYTLNAFGPGTDVVVDPVGVKDRGAREGRWGKAGLISAQAASSSGASAGGLRFRVLADGPYRAEIRDTRGALLESRSGIGPEDVGARPASGSGLFAVTVTTAGNRETVWLRAGR